MHMHSRPTLISNAQFWCHSVKKKNYLDMEKDFRGVDTSDSEMSSFSRGTNCEGSSTCEVANKKSCAKDWLSVWGFKIGDKEGEVLKVRGRGTMVFSISVVRNNLKCKLKTLRQRFCDSSAWNLRRHRSKKIQVLQSLQTFQNWENHPEYPSLFDWNHCHWQQTWKYKYTRQYRKFSKIWFCKIWHNHQK